VIPVLEKLFREGWALGDGLGAIIITPTRELALQIFEVRAALAVLWVSHVAVTWDLLRGVRSSMAAVPWLRWEGDARCEGLRSVPEVLTGCTFRPGPAQVVRAVGKAHLLSAGLLTGGKKEYREEQRRVPRMNIIVATPVSAGSTSLSWHLSREQ
jgi:hypothetical protein